MLTWSVRAREDAVTIMLDGDLWDPRDMETLASIVHPHLAKRTPLVVVDLTAVRQLGLIGLGTLLALKTQADGMEVDFRLSGGSDEIRSQLAKVALETQ